MNLAYIAYINGPKTAPPPNYYDPSQWRENLERQFLALPEIAYLNAQITAQRGAQNAPNTRRCRPLYVTELHDVKLARQCKWMIHLESAVCAALDSEMQAAGYPADTLVVAALPEFFWRDINDNDKHTDRTTPEYIRGYGKPFYGPVFDALSSNAQTLSAAPGAVGVPKTLCELTWKYQNLVVFAGTVWWKKIVKAACGGCGGAHEQTCAQCLQQSETMFNTMPVFHQGRRICLWNKQYLSDIDGLGDRARNLQKRANRKFEGSAFVAPPKPPANVPAGSWSIIGLSPSAQLSGLPWIQIVHNGSPVMFGMDICLDFIQGYDQTNRIQTGGPMSRDIITGKRLPEPDIQMLIAGGMSVDNHNRGNIFATHYLLRCDAICQPGGYFAEVWRPGATAPSAVLAAPAAGANPFVRSGPYLL